MTDWIGAWREMRDAGGAAVLVTVAGVRGSAPREVGARMLVTAREAIGTIGGGELEYQCTRIAAKAIGDASQGSGFLRRFPLGTNCGQCCGGVVDVLFERMSEADAWFGPLAAEWRERRPVALATTLDDDGRPHKAVATGEEGIVASAGAPDAAALEAARRLLARGTVTERVDKPGRGGTFLLLDAIADPGFELALFGAGHVGSAVVRTLAGIDCRLRWIDGRRDIFPTALPANVTAVESASPAQEVAAMPRQAFYLVMTHSHALDLEVVARVLARGDFAYCGLIGSRAKRRRFEQRLRQRGFTESQLASLVCPIGIRGIRGKQPVAIAIATAAQILERRERMLAARTDSGAAVHRLPNQQ